MKKTEKGDAPAPKGGETYKRPDNPRTGKIYYFITVRRKRDGKVVHVPIRTPPKGPGGRRAAARYNARMRAQEKGGTGAGRMREAAAQRGQREAAGALRSDPGMRAAAGAVGKKGEAKPALKPIGESRTKDVARATAEMRRAATAYRGTKRAAGPDNANEYVRPQVRAAAAKLKKYVQHGRKEGLDVVGAIRETMPPRQPDPVKPYRSGRKTAEIIAKVRGQSGPVREYKPADPGIIPKNVFLTPRNARHGYNRSDLPESRSTTSMSEARTKAGQRMRAERRAKEQHERLPLREQAAITRAKKGTPEERARRLAARAEGSFKQKRSEYSTAKSQKKRDAIRPEVQARLDRAHRLASTSRPAPAPKPKAEGRGTAERLEKAQALRKEREHVTVYHGTDALNVRNIRARGLAKGNASSQYAQASTKPERAIEYASGKQLPTVLEYKVPRREANAYLQRVRSGMAGEGEKLYGLKQRLPEKYLANVHVGGDARRRMGEAEAAKLREPVGPKRLEKAQQLRQQRASAPAPAQPPAPSLREQAAKRRGEKGTVKQRAEAIERRATERYAAHAERGNAIEAQRRAIAEEGRKVGAKIYRTADQNALGRQVAKEHGAALRAAEHAKRARTYRWDRLKGKVDAAREKSMRENAPDREAMRRTLDEAGSMPGKTKKDREAKDAAYQRANEISERLRKNRAAKRAERAGELYTAALTRKFSGLRQARLGR